MRLIPHLTLALALTLGASVVLTAEPVEAAKKKKKKQKKGDEPEVWKPTLSKEFIPFYKAANDAIVADDLVTAEAQIGQADAIALSGDDKYILGSLKLNLGTKKKDDAMRRAGIEQMLGSGVAPAIAVPQLSFFAGNFAYRAKEYDIAISRISEAVRLGYRKNNAQVLLAESYFKSDRVDEGFAALDGAIATQKAAGQSVSESWYRRGASMALRAKKSQEASKWTMKLVADYPTPDNWRTALTIYRDSTKLSTQDNLDLMRLMRKANALVSERDYGEYIDAADGRRLPGEVVAVLREGKAKGAFTASNQFLKEQLQLAQGRVSSDKASLPASERDSKSSANGKIAFATADAYLGYSNFTKAASLYAAALGKGGVDANRTNLRLAIAQIGMNDLALAKTTLAKVGGVQKPIADFWGMWIDTQAAPAAPAAAEDVAEPAT